MVVPLLGAEVTARGAEEPQIAGALRKEAQRLDQAAAACSDDCCALPYITEATT